MNDAINEAMNRTIDETNNDSINETIDEAVCPICGHANACAGSRSCWCAGESFPEGIFAFIPAEARGKACICRACLDRYTKTGHPLREETRETE
ncbi:cysteine-rich CWC family protein [Paenibacillus sp. GCM10023250]|uniref:cysteine-rich CWC family protein n=1 Tax=Paenibacillus sp. GCM10023250 TaxID=3252648 RepID=UPI00360A7771